MISPGYDTPRSVIVHPVWPNGRVASPAGLMLSQRELDNDPRFQKTKEFGGAEERSRRWHLPFDWRGRRSSSRPSATPTSAGPSTLTESPEYTFNTSSLVPLVSMDRAWMLDRELAANRSRGFDWGVARALSAYVSASYCNSTSLAAWNCTRCSPRGIDGNATWIDPNFALEALAWDEAWDLLGYVGWSEEMGATVIAFRGTDSHSYHNWVANMRTWRTDLNLTMHGAPANALVHGGFWFSWNASSLATSVTAAVRRLQRRHGEHPVYVSGHSLGGALATICALELRTMRGLRDVHLVTFGSPRVGNAVFAGWFERRIASHWRFTHNRDIVPSVPPPYMGFWHLAREVWVLDNARLNPLVGVCDGTGEDMQCHNSMCHLGLCSSIADHLLYISEMYTPRPMGC